MTERLCASLNSIPAALEKTGFVLEHQVAEAFKSAGWSIIGGRYYADDIDGRARELDLIAYKIFKKNELTVVYSVLVSCKKDSENTWVFLTRDKPGSDPNFDWAPVHHWTNINPLEKYLQSEKWKDGYISGAADAWNQLAAVRDVFAFQQINSKKVVPQNDTAVFSSITTLMKGLDYELMVLPQRQKNTKRIYFFSLLSVVDAPLVEARYSDGKVEAVEIEGVTHFARYMVRKREISALIRFVRSDMLVDEIARIDKLALSTAGYASSAVGDSFNSIKTSTSVQNYFAGRLQVALGWWLGLHLKKYGFSSDSVKLTSVNYENNVLVLGLDDIDDKSLAFLNSDSEVQAKTKLDLKKIARYEGGFVFEWDIPF